MKIYTEQEVIEAVKSAVERFPNRVNPMNDYVCLYTSPTDSTHHCIAGQVLADFGLRLPDVESDDNRSIIRQYLADSLQEGYFTWGALSVLAHAQAVFDEGGGWSECIGDFIERGGHE